MLKNALIFAGAAMLCVMMAPTFLPMLKPPPDERAIQDPIADVSALPTRAAPESPRQGFRELNIPDENGRYSVDAMVGGEPARFVVDTGATIVTISSDLANRLGLVETPSSPHYVVHTANGTTLAYGVKLSAIDLGSIYVSEIDALVDPNLGNVNLLGENFLARMTSVEQRDHVLILRQ
jgi:aspartyl protease family protein